MIGRVTKERKNVRLWKGDIYKPGERERERRNEGYSEMKRD